MKKFSEPLIIIISVYTRIPMPMVYWNDNNLKYAFCFLPAAGLLPEPRRPHGQPLYA